MLELQLDLPPGVGRRAGLEDALRQAIRDGRLTATSALPSSRVLAADLGVSRSTVVGAYEQLTAEGYLVSEHGRGTTVAPLAQVDSEATELDLFGPAPTWDLRPGEPDASAFPRRDWLQSLRRVVLEAPDDVLAYPDPRGRRELREVLAAHLARTRSVVTDANGVFVTGGFAAGLGFLADAFRRIGIEHIAVEEAMIPFHRAALRAAGLTVESIPVDAEGLDATALAATAARAVLVTPAHQYPYGVTMTPHRRQQLIAWAAETGAWIIEDDYDGEFRYDRRPIGALQGLDPSRVIYAGTASKSLGAGLRLGWMAVPEPLRWPLVEATNVRAGVSGIDQMALADFIERGRLDRQVRMMRRRYGQRREDVLETVDRVAPWLEPERSPAGLHLSCHTTVGPTERDVLAAADAASVGLMGLCTHHRAPEDRAGIVIGFSRPPEHAYRNALSQLEAVLVSLS